MNIEVDKGGSDSFCVIFFLFAEEKIGLVNVRYTANTVCRTIDMSSLLSGDHAGWPTTPHPPHMSAPQQQPQGGMERREPC